MFKNPFSNNCHRYTKTKLYESGSTGEKRDPVIIENNPDDLPNLSTTNNNTISSANSQSPTDCVSTSTAMNGGVILSSNSSSASSSVTKKRLKVESQDGTSTTNRSINKNDDIELKSIGSTVGRVGDENRVRYFCFLNLTV